MTSSLVGDVFAVNFPRRSHRHPARITPLDDASEGTWARCPTLYPSGRACRCQCVSRAGFHRRKCQVDRDGRCIICGREW